MDDRKEKLLEDISKEVYKPKISKFAVLKLLRAFDNNVSVDSGFSFDHIIDVVSLLMGLSKKDILSKSREGLRPVARYFIYYQLKLQGETHMQIGARFGKNQSNISHGMRNLSYSVGMSVDVQGKFMIFKEMMA